MRARVSWDALLAEFRALGGRAENVTLRHGVRGRGVFPIDSTKPAWLKVPANLLVRCEDTELRDGQLVAKESAIIGERERAFFNSYQRDFSWGAGVLDDLWQRQLAWSQLPQEIQDTLKEIMPISGVRFSEPSVDLCHRRYLASRSIMYHEVGMIMPLVELINHSGDATGYDARDGVVVGGMFNDEVLVSYSAGDCWGTAVRHGFSEARNDAYGLPGNFKFEDCRIEISRQFDRADRVNDVVMPTVAVDGSTVRFSFVMLGNVRFPHLPRAIFLHVAKDTPIREPDGLFDLIQHYNRLLLLKFLRRSEGPATPLVAMLRSAAYQQLETLSSHWGTGSPLTNSRSV
jgi:hypothetical protein